ncbi:MAG: formyltetrahydrofolate deformylase [Gammaproteobacteria bacterium]|nr:formyltetrahydrofolate deformylase [Gammaproteobacteria bacterium]MDH3560247.1 formyltetrahydrofolate deformylase [Gammaproteobacteria bacterium]
MSEKRSAILLISCPDQKGLVSSVTEFIFCHGGNIIDLEQHVDIDESHFFMRIEWDLAEFSIARGEIDAQFRASVGTRLGIQWTLYFSDVVPRMAVYVSRYSHCLYDILSRYQAGDWQVEVPLVISNHPDLRAAAEGLGIDYHVVPTTAQRRPVQEQHQLALLQDYNIDFIVLARYMQVLSEDFIRHYPSQIINIHHSFLPAFPGARPYHSAHKRGVKLIGATSHYATADLDAGPIIEQDVVHVRHTDSVTDLIRKGQDLEKIVLSRAIWRHLQRQVLVFRNRTIVFG